MAWTLFVERSMEMYDIVWETEFSKHQEWVDLGHMVLESGMSVLIGWRKL